MFNPRRSRLATRGLDLSEFRAKLTADEAQESFRRVVGELLRFDAERGVNVWAGSADPVMLVWSPRLYEFLVVLEEVLSFQPARGLCREVGYRSGYDGAVASVEAMGLKPGDRVQALLAMPRVLGGAGWGLCEIEYDDAGEIRWSFPGGTAIGAVAARNGARQNPACAFFEGFGAGWAKGSVGLDVEFLETACRGITGQECRFESRRVR